MDDENKEFKSLCTSSSILAISTSSSSSKLIMTGVWRVISKDVLGVVVIGLGHLVVRFGLYYLLVEWEEEVDHLLLMSKEKVDFLCYFLFSFDKQGDYDDAYTP